MDNIIETLYITFSLVVLFFIPIVLFIIINLIKRKGFYVSVNCWFCNTWCKVLYADRNSFYCPACLQYNGFDDDGGYNKIIKEQFITSFSKCNKTSKKTEPMANGLCTYCNNNQQLKVYQLANFTPLNENNYDIEIEHFEKQLEKAYKLCKKCDNVLKTTIEKQHAWIFGNRLKAIRKKGLSLLSKSSQRVAKKIKEPFYLNIIKGGIILLSMLVICYTLDVSVNYPADKIKKFIPDSFIPYTVFLNNLFNSVSKNVNSSITELDSVLPQNIKLNVNNFTPITCVGFLLEIFLVIYDHRSIWWKVNELLGWILLIVTSLISFHEHYVLFVNALQIFCSAAIICSLLSTDRQKQRHSSVMKKFEFKKLKTNMENSDNSDIDEEVSDLSNSSASSKKTSSVRSFKGNKELNGLYCQSGASQGVSFQNKVQKTARLNNSFTTATTSKTASILNTSFKNASNLSSSSELHHSLDNLHLSSLNLKPQTCTSPVFSVNPVNRSVLSPPKLKNITQNSWTAGGFWKGDVTLFPASNGFTNLSRSSSQTSGFVSNNEPVNMNSFSSLPPSREPSVCGDFERTSVLSEPPYHFQPIGSNKVNAFQSRSNLLYSPPQSPRLPLPSSQLYYKTENNVFYPVLNQSNMLFIQGGSNFERGSNIPRSNFEHSFSNLSLKGFNTNANSFSNPPLFSKQPGMSNLFKNIQGISTQPHGFKTPHC